MKIGIDAKADSVCQRVMHIKPFHRAFRMDQQPAVLKREPHSEPIRAGGFETSLHVVEEGYNADTGFNVWRLSSCGAAQMWVK